MTILKYLNALQCATSFLWLKDNKIPETVDEVVNILNVEEDLRESVTSYVKIVQSHSEKIKKIN